MQGVCWSNNTNPFKPEQGWPAQVHHLDTAQQVWINGSFAVDQLLSNIGPANIVKQPLNPRVAWEDHKHWTDYSYWQDSESTRVSLKCESALWSRGRCMIQRSHKSEPPGETATWVMLKTWKTKIKAGTFSEPVFQFIAGIIQAGGKFSWQNQQVIIKEIWRKQRRNPSPSSHSWQTAPSHQQGESKGGHGSRRRGDHSAGPPQHIHTPADNACVWLVEI